MRIVSLANMGMEIPQTNVEIAQNHKYDFIYIVSNNDNNGYLTRNMGTQFRWQILVFEFD